MEKVGIVVGESLRRLDLGKEDAEHTLPAHIFVPLVPFPDLLLLFFATALHGPLGKSTGLSLALMVDESVVVGECFQAAVTSVFGIHVLPEDVFPGCAD